MRVSHLHVAGLLVLALIATGAAGAFGQDAADHTTDHLGDHMGQHGVGHAEMHDVYKAWHPPDNPKASCCNNADRLRGRRALASLREQGIHLLLHAGAAAELTRAGR